MRAYGVVDDSYHLSEPLGNVLKHPNTGELTYVAFNPNGIEQVVTVYQAGVAVGCFIAPLGVLTVVNELEECNAGLGDAAIPVAY